MQFGLDRMHALMEALGHPEQRFDAIHVVGSNGKSSTVRFCEALLEAEGVATGAYTSPHITTFRERIRIGGETISAEALRAGGVGGASTPGDEVTQFEALTGGRVRRVRRGRRRRWRWSRPVSAAGWMRPTCCARSRVQVLTNVSLEHSELLGETRERIAAEKLAVVPERRRPGDRRGRLGGRPHRRPRVRKVVTVGGSYQDQNRAVARAAVEALLGRPVDPAPIERLEVAGAAGGARPASARDLGRCPQPGRHAAAGRRAAARCSATAGGGRVRGDGRQGRGVDGLAAAARCARPSSPPPPATRGRFRPTPWRRWPGGPSCERPTEALEACAGAGRAERRGRGVRIAVPAARSQR